MTTNKKLLFASVLVAPLLVFGTVAAEEGDPPEDTSTTTQTTTQKPKTGNEGLTLEQRIQKYKTQLQTKLNNAEKLRVTSRCKASQGKVSSIKGRITGLETSRQQVYANLTSRLTDLSSKLKAKGLDTAALDSQIAELQIKVDTFNTDLAKYKEAVGDLAEMNCTTDPDAFKASLETARTLRAQVVKDGQAIKSYLSDTIKPTLVGLRKQLETDTNDGEG